MITGWGNYIHKKFKTNIYYPKNIVDLKKILGKKSYKSMAIRGNGRSYGDSSIGKKIISIRDFNKKIKIDNKNKILYCSANCTMGEINEVLIKRNFFFRVTPGTKFVTIGGAIASDIHGKNHHLEGSMSETIKEIELLLSNKTVIKCSKTKNKEIFKATLGGMGLTGVILNAKIKLKKITSEYIYERKVVSKNLKETIEHFEKYRNWEYIVSWVDMSAENLSLGRGITYLGKHTNNKIIINKKDRTFNIFFPSFFLNNFFLKIYNKLFFHLSKINKQRKIHLNQYFYPLDKIKNWNKLYGKNGFIQIQVLLKKKNILKNLTRLIEFFQINNKYSFITSLKKLGKKNNNYLSFPEYGYTIAMDIKYSSNIEEFHKKLENELKKINAKLYLTKDSLMRSNYFKSTYPELHKFKKIKIKIDKRKFFQSSQSKRLSIV